MDQIEVEMMSLDSLLYDGIGRLIRKAVEYDKNIQILFYTDDYLCSTDRYLVVLGAESRFLMHNVDMNDLLTVKPKEYSARVLKEDSPLVEYVEKYGRSLDEYYWHVVSEASNGRLIEGLQETDVISLKSWPNLTRLAKSPNTYRMAALFVARPTTMEVASRLLSVSMDELRQFYSAAYCSGYAEPVNREAETNINFKPHKYVKVIRNLLGVISSKNTAFAR